MIKKEIKDLDTFIYEKELKCGLKIYVCPMDRHEAHARIVTKYGSSILEFKPANSSSFVNIPFGTAHFLEHKMFAKEDGTDIMDIFQKNGAINNAYTSAFKTVYYYTAPTHFFSNLKNLLDLVTEPYYSVKEVLKEQGIIDQEIKAGFDNPNNMAYYTTIFNTFEKNPFRYPVAGYTESIKKITPEILYDCYNTFYHPSNMYMVISGNVSPDKTIEFIEKYYDEKGYKKAPLPEIKKYDEKRTVFKKREVVKRDVTNKIIEMAYKVYIGDLDMPLYKILAYLDLYLTVKFGSISSFNKKNFEDKNVLNKVGWFVTVVDDYLMVDFDTEVINVDDIFKKIDLNLNDKSFSSLDFDLIKKNILKDFVLNFDSVYGVSNFIDYQVQMYGRVIYDMRDVLASLNYDDCLELILKLDFSNKTETVVSNN